MFDLRVEKYLMGLYLMAAIVYYTVRVARGIKENEFPRSIILVGNMLFAVTWPFWILVAIFKKIDA